MANFYKLRRILIVDDDHITNKLAKRLLEKSEVADEIHVVTDGQKALDYLLNPAESFPDLIFLDISMPVMDGFEFLKKFSTSNTEAKNFTRIIILTQFFREEDIKGIADYDEVIGYMPKPLNQEKIEQAYRYYIQKINKPIAG